MTDALKRLDDIRSKITGLQAQEKALQLDLSNEVSKVINDMGILTIDFKTLVGGLLHIREESQTNLTTAEAWKYSGEKFLRARTKQKSTPEKSKSESKTLSGDTQQLHPDTTFMEKNSKSLKQKAV